MFCQFLPQTGSPLCWNLLASISSSTPWYRLRRNDSASVFEKNWPFADRKLPTPLKDDVREAASARFDASNGQFVATKLDEAANQLACAYFFQPSDIKSLGTPLDVHSITVAINGTIFAKDRASAEETRRLTYGVSICWYGLAAPHCKLPVNGGSIIAGSVDVGANTFSLNTTFDIGGPDELDLFEPASSLALHLNISSSRAAFFVINGIDLQVNATVGKPSSTGARIVSYIADKFGVLRDFSAMSIAALVVTSFYCGVVCTGVIWSICRRGKKPIAYDKQ